MDALAPHVSQETLEYHYGKHHKAYVDNLNNLQKGTEFESMALEDIVKKATGGIYNNAAQIWNHTFFWSCMKPGGGGEPKGALAEQIKKDFGSFAIFKKQMTACASTVMGSGWGALVWEPLLGRLMTVQIYDHQSNITQAGVPIMVLDAWEHAWYLQYENRKTDFFDATWNLWNWADIAARFEQAKALELKLVGATA